ncbi:nucleoside deaminase [Geofilum rubicundum]|nr:nucleoside deaminase [Geofilum rubicundum]
MHNHTKYMRMAIDLANKNIQMGGGPFGAVIVRQNEVVGAGSNQVTNHNDPTAHAEILAIREASQNLNDYNLSDCTLYTTCEPCPMCLGAIYWARIPHVFFGNNRQDAAGIGFDDDFIYKEIQLPLQKRSILMEPMLGEEAIATFKQWANLPHKTEY